MIHLEDKLAKDGNQRYSTRSAFESLLEKIAQITRRELAQDLLPLFENRAFTEAWLDAFHANFERFSQVYFND